MARRKIASDEALYAMAQQLAAVEGEARTVEEIYQTLLTAKRAAGIGASARKAAELPEAFASLVDAFFTDAFSLGWKVRLSVDAPDGKHYVIKMTDDGGYVAHEAPRSSDGATPPDGASSWREFAETHLSKQPADDSKKLYKYVADETGEVHYSDGDWSDIGWFATLMRKFPKLLEAHGVDL